MPTSVVKKEYWCLFKGDQVTIVEGRQELNKQHKLIEHETMVVYCAEIDEGHILYNNSQFMPLKRTLDTLEPLWYSIATKAFAILNWDRNHQYCGRCGTKLNDHVVQNAICFERECLQCHLIFYPRISPSVIVRIVKDDQLLMARSPHFPPGVYGLIAGFVEAGESLEEAVHREVQEEVGIKIKNLCYFGSQPWPFPDSLMVAFTAEYESGELTVDKTELEHAGWYRYDQLPGRPSTRISISNQLIEDFINGIS